MSAPQPGSREVVLGLAEALRPALVAGAPAIAIVAARDVARLMGLPGLDAALAELERHPRAPWPLDVQHVADRIRRMAESAALDGDLRAFHHAERELGTLAAQLAATVWSLPTARGRGVATIAADETLAGLAVEASPEALRTRVTMTVASAVRAAIDWLGADESPRVTLDVHDSALTITVTATHTGGIGPAGAVLAAVEGSLGREPDGRWTIRVAASTERGSYLLLRQGRYGVALPWHSVARLRMFAPHELERLAEPRLAPLSTGRHTAGEQPAALVALGLVRAWFVADRIVWRISARAEEADVAGPFAGGTRMVEVESGERYWVLEPAWLLRGIAPPDAPPPSPRPRTSTLSLEAPPATGAAAPAEPPPVSQGESLAEAVERALAQLRFERVGPAAIPAAPVAPAADAASASDAGTAPTPNPDESVMFEAHVDVMLSAPAAEPASVEDAIAAPGPIPAPAPEPLPVPDPAPGPAPIPAPAPEPLPVPEPEPAPAPEPLPVPEPEPAPVPNPAPVPVPEPERAPVPEPVPEPERAFRAPPPAAAPPAPVVAGGAAAAAAAPERAPAADPEPLAEPEPLRALRPSELAARVPTRRALIADDSLVARIFLGRLLEKRGWVVEAVADAAAMWDALHRGPWALVCADIALPDAQGETHVRRLVDFLGRRFPPTPCVVLTRDGDDERIAHEGGATLVLRKPFEPDRLDSLLPR